MDPGASWCRTVARAGVSDAVLDVTDSGGIPHDTGCIKDEKEWSEVKKQPGTGHEEMTRRDASCCSMRHGDSAITMEV